MKVSESKMVNAIADALQSIMRQIDGQMIAVDYPPVDDPMDALEGIVSSLRQVASGGTVPYVRPGYFKPDGTMAV